MAKLSASQAAKLVGKSVQTITRACKSGKISSKPKKGGGYEIEPSELFRVFPPLPKTEGENPAMAGRGTPFDEEKLRREIEELRTSLKHSEQNRQRAEEDAERWREESARWHEQAKTVGLLIERQKEQDEKPVERGFLRFFRKAS